MDPISKFRISFFSLFLSNSSINTDFRLDMNYLAKKYDINPIALFVAEYDDKKIQGPVGGQISTFNLKGELSQYKDSIALYVNFKINLKIILIFFIVDLLH